MTRTSSLSLLVLSLFLTNCATLPQSNDPHDRLSSFVEQVAANNWVTGFDSPTLSNLVVDYYEPDNGGVKMRARNGRLNEAIRHSIAPVGDYDFSFVHGTGGHAVSVTPTGGSIRVRVWQRHSQTSGPSTLILDRTIQSGQHASVDANLTPGNSYMVTRVEGVGGKRLVYDITYRRL